jgi:hypothetical protein
MAAILVFLPALLSGMLLVHILWPDGRFWSLAVKVFLGMGVGLGLRSLLYFLYLLVLPARNAFIFIDLACLLTLLSIAVVMQRRTGSLDRALASPPALSRARRRYRRDHVPDFAGTASACAAARTGRG